MTTFSLVLEQFFVTVVFYFLFLFIIISFLVLNFSQVECLVISTIFNNLMFRDFVAKVNSIKINFFPQLFPKKRLFKH